MQVPTRGGCVSNDKLLFCTPSGRASLPQLQNAAGRHTAISSFPQVSGRGSFHVADGKPASSRHGGEGHRASGNAATGSGVAQ